MKKSLVLLWLTSLFLVPKSGYGQFHFTKDRVLYFYENKVAIYEKGTQQLLDSRTLQYCASDSPSALDNFKILTNQYGVYRIEEDLGAFYKLEDCGWVPVKHTNAPEFVGQGRYFMHDRYLYRFGGLKEINGLNNLSRLDLTTGAWQQNFDNSYDGHDAIGSLRNYDIDVYAQKLHVSKGVYRDVAKDSFYKINLKVFVFDLGGNAWSDLNLPVSKVESFLSTKFYGSDDQNIYLHDPVRELDGILNFESNKITYYHPTFNHDIMGGNYQFKIEEGYVYSVCDQLNLSRYRIGQERFVEKASIEPTEILNNSTSQILLLVFVFMTLMAIFYGKKFLATSDMQLRKQAVTIDGLVLSYSRAKVILTEQERMALSKLSAGDALGTDFILDGVLGGEISMSHAHKLRSDLMRALNKKILELTNISEVIIAQKHQTDRRIKRYIIDPKYLHLFRNMDQQSEST